MTARDGMQYGTGKGREIFAASFVGPWGKRWILKKWKKMVDEK